MMIQKRYDMPYSEILESTNRTTRRIVFTAATLALTVVFHKRVFGTARSMINGAVSIMGGLF